MNQVHCRSSIIVHPLTSKGSNVYNWIQPETPTIYGSRHIIGYLKLSKWSTVFCCSHMVGCRSTKLPEYHSQFHTHHVTQHGKLSDELLDY